METPVNKFNPLNDAVICNACQSGAEEIVLEVSQDAEFMDWLLVHRDGAYKFLCDLISKFLVESRLQVTQAQYDWLVKIRGWRENRPRK